VCLQYGKRGENGPVNDDKQTSRLLFRSEIDSYARRPTIFGYLFRGSLTGDQEQGTYLNQQMEVLVGIRLKVYGRR